MLYLEVLKNRNFTYLLIGNFLRLVVLSFSLQIIWFTVELTNQSSLKLSMMVMSQTLPFIRFGIFGGAYSDKHNKKKILYLSDLMKFDYNNYSFTCNNIKFKLSDASNHIYSYHHY